MVTLTLSTEQLEQYDRDGIVFPVDVLSPGETTMFRQAFELIAEGDGALKRLDSLHLFFAWAYRLATHKKLLNVVEDLLGSDILIDGTLVFHKPPRDLSYVSWHQDSLYSGWHMTPSTSAWIALSPSDKTNGCMRVIPGSHRQGLLAHSKVQDDLNLLDRGDQVETVDETLAINVVLKPGQVSFHQSNLVHGSRSNASNHARIGFIVRFVTNLTNTDRPLVRVRGRGDCSHLQLVRPPEEMDHRVAFSAWRAASSV